MNYEYRIRELEAELEHLRKRQQIQRDQLNDHANWQEYTGSRMYAVEAALEKLTQTVDRFIASLQSGRTNGDQK